MLVTDAMAAAAAADGDYRLGRLDVTVRDGVARLADTGAIAGSTADDGRRGAVRRPGRRAAASRTSSARPPPRRPPCTAWTAVGALRPGFDADLVVLDDDLEVQRVMRKGAWVG